MAQFDAASMVGTLRRIAQQTDPHSAQQLDSILMRISMQMGMDVQTDFLNSLGTTWVSYTDPAIAGPTGIGTVLINPLRKPKVTEAALNRLEQTLNQMILQQEQRSPLRCAWCRAKKTAW